MIHVIQHKLSLFAWQDDVLPNEPHEFKNYTEARQALQRRVKNSPHETFRITTRKRTEDVLYPVP